MAVEFRPFHVGDLFFVQAQPEQRMQQQFMQAPAYVAELADGVALTAWLDSRVIACAGIVRQPARDRTMAWALLSMQARQRMLPLSLKIIRVLNTIPEDRVQMNVRIGHTSGHEWAKVLGFLADHEELNDVTGEAEMAYVRVR